VTRKQQKMSITERAYQRLTELKRQSAEAKGRQVTYSEVIDDLIDEHERGKESGT
jgi:predicted CopG family antitoxin